MLNVFKIQIFSKKQITAEHSSNVVVVFVALQVQFIVGEHDSWSFHNKINSIGTQANTSKNLFVRGRLFLFMPGDYSGTAIRMLERWKHENRDTKNVEKVSQWRHCHQWVVAGEGWDWVTMGLDFKNGWNERRSKAFQWRVRKNGRIVYGWRVMDGVNALEMAVDG